jgi:hypothetical protein
MSDNKYYIVENGKKSGPFSIEELKTKNIKTDTLVWYEGLDNWKKAKEIEKLRIIIKKKKNGILWILLLIVFLIIYILSNIDVSENDYETFKEPEIANEETESVVVETNLVSGEDFEKVRIEANLNKLIEAVDFENPVTNDYAVRLASIFPGEYNIGQVCQIYDYIVKRWKYVNDSDKKENFRSASRSINNNLAGDCDDFAILIAAMIESIGGDARISFAYNGSGGHAFTEVLATNSKEDMQLIVDEINRLYGTNSFRIYYYPDQLGRCWLNLDWFGNQRHPGGEYFNFTKRIIYYPTANPPYFEN